MSYLEKLAEDNFQDGVLHELKRIAVATEKIADALGKQNDGTCVLDKGCVIAKGIAAEFANLGSCFASNGPREKGEGVIVKTVLGGEEIAKAVIFLQRRQKEPRKQDLQ